MSTLHAEICEGESYSINGSNYTSAGIYDIHLTNAVGCDSALTLTLTVKSKSVSTTTASIKMGDAYLFNGTAFTTAGTYMIHLTNAVGCDSAATLVLTVIGNYTINGNIRNPKGQIIPNVTVGLNGKDTTITDSNGDFQVVVTPDSNYTIRPKKNNDKLIANGINGTDISLIQSHILKKVILNSPFKLIAADVNNDGAVNGTDIALIKSIVLKRITSFSGNRLWSFVDSSFVFATPTKPFPYRDSIYIHKISASQTSQSFVGVKLGDVNYDWNVAILGNANKSTPIELFNNQVAPNAATTEVRVPVRVKNFRNIMGIQYTLNFNQEVLELKSIENNTLGFDYNTDYSHEGKLAMLWVNPKSEAESISDSTVLFELVFKQKKSLVNDEFAITSDITEVNAIDGNYTSVGIINSLRIKTEELISMDNLNVYPNPTKDMVTIKGSHINKIQLIDNMGKVVKETKFQEATNPSISLGKYATGVYRLLIQTADGKVKNVNLFKE